MSVTSKRGSRRRGSKGETQIGERVRGERKPSWKVRRRARRREMHEEEREEGRAGGGRRAGRTRVPVQSGRREGDGEAARRGAPRTGKRARKPDGERGCFRRTSCDYTPTARWRARVAAAAPGRRGQRAPPTHPKLGSVAAASKAGPLTVSSLLPRHQRFTLTRAS